jgi:hypothetical protein
MATQVIEFSVPGGYLRRDEVLDRLGISGATIERMARDERLKSKLVPVPGRKSERVYLAEDVERFKKTKEKREALKPPSARLKPKLVEAGTPEGKGGDMVVMKGASLPLNGIKELLESWFAKRQVSLREKIWLTWEEAVQLSGIPMACVRQDAKDGRIVARRFGRSWRVLRKSLLEARWE